MAYIEKTLSKNEEIYKTFQHHWIVKFYIIFHLVISFFTVGLWLPVALFLWLKWRNIEQAVTTKRVIQKVGIISRRTDEMRLSAIESITIAQGIIGRIFGFGSVTVTGRGAGDVVIKWMANPQEVKRAIEDADDDARS